jgi:hypothetical protein
MVLHLVPDTYFREQVEREQEEIRLAPTDMRPPPPFMRDWVADNDQQTITHIPSGCQFRAYPVETPMAAGFVTPFGARYEVAVRFVGMIGVSQCPAPEQVREIGLQGIEWILTFTFEARRR